MATPMVLRTTFWRALWLRRRTSRSRRQTQDALLLGLAGSTAALLAHGLVDYTVLAPDLAVALFLTLGLSALDPGGSRRHPPQVGQSRL